MRVTRSIVLAALATLGAAACGKNSTSPTPAPSTAPVVAKSVAIVAPSTIAPGTTVQLSLTATLSDGSTKDVTSLATWLASSPYVTVSSTGQATGQRPGLGMVIATYQSLHATQNVNILAPNTYMVSGRILDQGVPLTGANVIASNGGTAVGHTVTGSTGTYAFWGVASTFALEVDEYGYTTQTVTETVSANGPLPDITLQETTTPADLSGAWTLTLAADPTCAAALPSDAQSRTYSLTVTEQGTHFTGTVTSSTLSSQININDGRVIGSAFSFDYPASDYYYFSSLPIDMLSGGRSLEISGIVTGTATGSSFVVPFSASFDYYTGSTNVPAQAVCFGPNGTASFQRGSSAVAKRIRR